MFIGHFAVGFASKKFAPRTHMAVLIAAPLFARRGGDSSPPGLVVRSSSGGANRAAMKITLPERNQHELHRSAMPD
jgi:hypothetical protein